MAWVQLLYGVLPGDCRSTSVVVEGPSVDVRRGPVPTLPRHVHDAHQELTVAMRVTDRQAPMLEHDGSFVDRFNEVRKMIDAFNQHYANHYHPSWLNCLDESMCTWRSKYCPGFMCVPRKPHPFGNEYHSIADRDDGKSIMWRVKIVEGKNRPKRANGQYVFLSEFPGLGKTSTRMLEMTKPIHEKGKVVVGDSGFCMREGVVECHKRGVWFPIVGSRGSLCSRPHRRSRLRYLQAGQRTINEHATRPPPMPT